jgi:hypothetical protein
VVVMVGHVRSRDVQDVGARRKVGALLMLVGLLATLFAFVADPAAAVDVGADPAGDLTGFEIEGNQAVDNDDRLDWDDVDPVIVVDDTLDSGLQGTSKENDPSGWVCNTGGDDPGKTDILAAAVNARVTADAIFLDLAYARADGNGSAHVNFEFNQGEISAVCPNVGRQTGDLLLLMDFPGNGASSGIPAIEAFLWDDTITADGEWVPNADIPATVAAGAENDGDLTDGLFGLGTLADREFGEFSIDLLEALDIDPSDGICRQFGTLNVRSRSSGSSISSALQDTLPPTAIDLSTCGSVTVEKTDDAGNPLADATFGLFATEADADALVNPLQTCVTDDEGTCTFTDVAPGDYFVAEIDAPDGYDLDPTVAAVSVDFREEATVEHVFVDPRHTGFVEITKVLVDENGGPLTPDELSDLDGATFELRQGGTVASLWPTPPSDDPATCTITGGTGSCVIGPVPVGTYAVVETVAPPGTTPGPQPADVVVVQGTEAQAVAVSYPNVSETPLVTVVKEALPTQVAEPGADVAFSVDITNDSTTETLTIDELTDDVFGDLLDPTNAAITANDCDELAGDELLPGATVSCGFIAEITGNAGDQHVDVVTVVATDDEGQEATDDDDATVDVTDVLPVVTVVKDPSPSQLTELGGDVTYTVQVANPVTAVEAITITSLVDDRFGTLLGDDDCELGTVLEPGEFCAFQFTETLPGQDPGTTHINVVTAKATDDDGNEVSASDPATVTFTDVLPEVSIDKLAAPTSVPETGGNVTFTFTVTNEGDEAGTITTLSDDRFGALAGDADCQVGTVLAAGDDCSFTLVVNLAQDEGTSHTNVVTVVLSDDDDNTDSDTDDAVVTFTDVLPVISVVKEASPASAPEATPTDVTFSVTVTNQNAESVTLDSLVDDVFGDLDGVGTCATGGTIAGGGGTYSCSFTESLTGDAGEDHVDVVTAIASDDDGNSDEDDDDATVTFTDVLPVITVDKSADPVSLPEPGGDVTFTVVVTNDSIEPVEITSLDDDVFGTLDGDADCEVGTVLAVGGSCEFEFTEPVTGNAGLVHVDVVTATAEDDEGNEASATDDAVVVISDVGSSIEVTKTADPTSVPEPGAAVTFTVDVENTSLVDSITIDSIVDDVFGDLGDAGNAAVTGSTCPDLIGDVLAVDEVVSCTFVAFIGDDAVVGDDSEHENTVLVSGTDDDDLPVADDDDATVDITDVLPTVTVDKEADVESVPEATPTEVTFTVTVTNGSVEPVEITSLVDDVFGVLDGDADCEVGTVLPVGGSCEFEFTETLTGDAGVDHENTVTVVVVDDEGNEADDDDPETFPYTDVPPVVSVDKEADVESVPEATPTDVTFTVTVTNGSVEPVTITSLVDDVFGVLDGDADCQVGTVLPVGGSCEFEFTETLTGDAGVDHENTVTVVVVDDEGTEDEDDDPAVVPFTDVPPSVVVTKDSDAVELTAGTPTSVTFTVTVTNGSPEPVTITSLTDSEFGALVGDADCQVGTVLAVGASCTFTFVETLTVTADGHSNTVTVVVTDDEGTTGTDQDDEVIPATVVLPQVITRQPAQPAQPAPTQLPRTGMEVRLPVGFGLLLIGVGAYLLQLGPRRRFSF